MKIDSVAIRNFAGIEKLDVRLSNKVFIIGDNEVGKSSLLRAIEYGMAGEVFSPEMGKGLGGKHFIKPGAEDFHLTLKVEKKGVEKNVVASIVRKSSLGKKESTKQEKIDGFIGLDKEKVLVALNSSRILRVADTVRRKLLADMLAIEEVTFKQFLSLYRSWADQNPSIFEKYGIQKDEDLTPLFEVPPESISEALTEATNKRTKAKKDAEAARSICVQFVNPDTMNMGEDFEKMVVEMEKDLNAGWTDLIKQANEREQLTKELEASEVEMAQLKEVAENAPAEMKEKKKLIKEIEQKIEAKERERMDLQARRDKLNVTMDIAGEVMKILERKKEKPEECLIASAGIACPLKAEDFAEALEHKTQELANQIEEAELVQADLLALSDSKNQLIGQRVKIKERVSWLEEQIEDYGVLVVGLDAVRNRLQELPENLEEASGKKLAIDKKRDDLRTAKSTLQNIKNHKRAERLEDVSGRWEILVSALGISGVQKMIVKEKVGVLEDRLNENMKFLLGENWLLKFSFDSGYDLMISDDGGQHWRDFRLASGSQLMRIGLAVSEAFAKEYGIELLVLDGIDILDATRKKVMIDFIKKVSGSYDQVIVTCTKATKEIGNGAIEVLMQVFDEVIEITKVDGQVEIVNR